MISAWVHCGYDHAGNSFQVGSAGYVGDDFVMAQVMQQICLAKWRGMGERFNSLLKTCPSPMMSGPFHGNAGLVAGKKDYSVWQPANLWLIYEALALASKNLTLLAL
jgi:hypothetical protein